MLDKVDALLAAIHLVVLRHCQLIGCDEVEGRAEVPHGRQEAVDRAAVLEVAHKVDVQVLQRALRLVDGVEVEHRLTGMLIGTVSRIDDGHRRHLAGILGCTFQIMTHDDDVGIVRYHHYRVLQRLTLRAARHLRVCKADDLRTKTIGCRLEAETSTRAWLKEQGGNYSSLEQATVGVLLKLLRHADEVLYLLSRMVGYSYKTSIFHCFSFFCAKVQIKEEREK